MTASTQSRRGRPRPHVRVSSRPRAQTYLPLDFHRRFQAYCAANGMTESAGVYAGLRLLLGEEEGHWGKFFRWTEQINREWQRSRREMERMQREHAVLLEAFGIYVQLWFAHTPKIPAEANEAAKRMGASRFEAFSTFVRDAFQQGPAMFERWTETPSPDPSAKASEQPTSAPVGSATVQPSSKSVQPASGPPPVRTNGPAPVTPSSPTPPAPVVSAGPIPVTNIPMGATAPTNPPATPAASTGPARGGMPR
jgi:hypothetical protein